MPTGTPTDDERLLTGEVRRALARLRAVRNVLDQLLNEEEITVATYNKLVVLTHEEQG